MTMQLHVPVVVGVDGSEHSLRAVDIAAEEASRRGRRLRVVSVVHLPVLAAPAAPGVGLMLDNFADAARVQVDEAAHRVAGRWPSLEVTTEVITGYPAGVLVQESDGAHLLVVGHRGRGGFAGLLAGSVATQVAAHARCPVIVSRPADPHAAEHAPGGRVVVGVDGRGNSAAAVAFAFEEASIRRAPLVAVHAWADLPVWVGGDFEADPENFSDARSVAARILSEAIAGYGETYPDVAVLTELVEGPDPAAALVEQSRDSALIVVGSRGRGTIAGLMLGSVGHTLIHRAACPVAVVHPDGAPDGLA